MTALAAATESLVICLDKAAADLDFVSHRLEEEFQQRYGSTTADPMCLLKRIKRLQRDLPEVRSECHAVLEAKQNLIDAAKRQLTGNRDTLQRLQSKVGIPKQEDDETFAAFCAALSEWEAKTALHNTGGGPALSRDDLNKAFVQSVFGAL
ncbi:hypothetical protein WJX72_000213 [[Myrmecia] bisecta]|uniref:Protein FAM33A n=1 Tax=[Myrmecia] bisecta TaxID=41462 RepID=A0AAW1P7X4_9CHLO